MQIIKSVSRWISRVYSLPLMLGLLLASCGFFWMFNFSNLPVSNPSLMRLSNGEGLLDVRLFYSAEEAFRAMDHYGPAGRGLYYRFLAADFIFIPVNSLGFAFLMSRTVRAAACKADDWSLLSLLPIAIGLLDIAEDLCILGMLWTFPGSSRLVGTLSGVATLSKYLVTAATVLCLASGGIVVLLCRLGVRQCAGQKRS